MRTNIIILPSAAASVNCLICHSLEAPKIKSEINFQNKLRNKTLSNCGKMHSMLLLIYLPVEWTSKTE